MRAMSLAIKGNIVRSTAMCASTSRSSFLAMISSTSLGMTVGRPARVSTKERPFFMLDKVPTEMPVDLWIWL